MAKLSAFVLVLSLAVVAVYASNTELNEHLEAVERKGKSGKRGGQSKSKGSQATKSVWDDSTLSTVPGSSYDGTCVGDLDVCIAIDESSSIGEANFKKSIVFARALISHLVNRMPASNPPRFAGYMFDEDVDGSSDALQKILTADYDSFLSKLNSVQYDGGKTNIYAGLKACRESLITSQRNKLVLLLSDGIQNVQIDGSGSVTDADLQAVEELAESMTADDDIVIPVLAFFTSSLKQRDWDYLSRVASQGRSKRSACTQRSDSNDRSLFYSFDFARLNAAIGKYMANELCDKEVSIIPGTVDEDICYCVRHEIENPGYCVRVVDDSTAVNGVSTCEYDGCTKERFSCDVASTDAECRKIEDTTWVCLPGSNKEDGTCDCELRQIQRVVFERFV